MRDSVVLNKCDDLSAIYHLTLVNYKVVIMPDNFPPTIFLFYLKKRNK